MTKQGLWSEKEIKFLRKYYPVKGGKYVAQVLRRSTHSVYNHARKFGLKVLISIYYRPYTPREIILIKKYYPTKGAKYVAKLLDREPGKIKDKARRLKVRRINTTIWSSKEIEYLRKWYFKKRPSEIAKKLKRTTPAVVTRARMLGLIKHVVKKWTSDEELFLINNYRKMTYKQIAKHLNRTVGSVTHKVTNMLTMRKLKTRKWKPSEKRTLRRLYGKISVAEIAARLNRTEDSVRHQATVLKLTAKGAPPYTEAEIEFIRNNYLKMTNVQIGKILKRTPTGIVQIAKRLKLTANPIKKKLWDRIPKRSAELLYTEEEKEFIRMNYLKMTSREIGEKLGRTKNAIQSMMRKLKLTGNPERKAVWAEKRKKIKK